METKETKAFLRESDDHLYGGISQGKVDLEEQKVVIKEIEHKSKIDENMANPTCKLLNDGSDYTIFGVDDTKIYNGSTLKSVKESVLFN